MGSIGCRSVVCVGALNMADAPQPEMSVAEGSTPGSVTVPVPAVPVPAETAESSVPAGEADKTGVTSPPPALTPATPDKKEENAPSPQDVHLSSTVSSLDTATKAMKDMVVLFQQHSSEVSQVPTQLGFSGKSHKSSTFLRPSPHIKMR